jgi:hypothetical protein
VNAAHSFLQPLACALHAKSRPVAAHLNGESLIWLTLIAAEEFLHLQGTVLGDLPLLRWGEHGCKKKNSVR